MHDAFCVQVADCHANLQGVEFDDGFWQTLVRFENFVELTSFDEGHDKVESFLRLEQVLHTNKEWMVTAEKDIFLQTRVLNLLEIQENILADGLDSPLLVSLVSLKCGQENFTKSALSKQGNFLKVLKFDVLAGVRIRSEPNHDGLATTDERILVVVVSCRRVSFDLDLMGIALWFFLSTFNIWCDFLPLDRRFQRLVNIIFEWSSFNFIFCTTHTVLLRLIILVFAFYLLVN